MPAEKPTQSMNFSGAQLSGVQVGISGGSFNQTQLNSQVKAEKKLTSEEAVELIAQLITLFRNSDLTEEKKEKALENLEKAKKEAQETEPEKGYVAKSLQRATIVLKEANGTVGAGQGLWQKLEPIFSKLAPWLGIAAKNLSNLL